MLNLVKVKNDLGIHSVTFIIQYIRPDGPNFQKGKRTNRILDRLRARTQSQTRLKAAEESRKYAENRRDVVEKRKQMPVTAEDLWANGNLNDVF